MIMLCPDAVHGHQLPLQEFAEVWMQQVQADLGIKLMWLGSIHKDTDEWHAQFLLAGTSQTGEPFRIARPYISEKMRSRAAEVQSWYLGDA
jgi:type IV secretory pathway VirD2 relaxase